MNSAPTPSNPDEHRPVAGPNPGEVPPAAPLRRRRVMKTAWSVHVTDVLATQIITIGGIGTMVAVLLVFLFLAAVVVPLFQPARIEPLGANQAPWTQTTQLWGMDEYRSVVWTVDHNALLRAFRLDTGELFWEHPLPSENVLSEKRLSEKRVSAVARAGEKDVALGFADGSAAVGKLGFTARFLTEAQVPAEARTLQPGHLQRDGERIIHRTEQGQYRELQVMAELQPAVPLVSGPVVAIDYLPAPDGASGGTRVHRLVVANDQGDTRLSELREKRNALTRKVTQQTTTRQLPPWNATSRLKYLLLASRGDQLYRIGEGGLCQRWRVEATGTPTLMEEQSLVPEGRSVAVCRWILGRETLLCGDNRGSISGWFRAPQPAATTPDGYQLVQAHQLALQGPVPTCCDASQRSRLVALGYADGSVRLYHMTSERLALQAQVSASEPIQHVLLGPREDGLLAASGGTFWRATLQAGHSDVSLATLFLPVWYEGYPAPMHTWQSSSASSASENKLGLFVLIFGTLKATFYTMIFSAPLALVAAVYTSEFLHPRWRARVKPCIEMMASLPSVVLGFLAAMVFAPYAERATVTLITSLFGIPFMFVTGGYLWQMLPRDWTLRFARYQFMTLWGTLPLGFLLAQQASPAVERWLFAGEISLWLDGQIGSGTGGWLILLLPVSLVVVAVVLITTVNPWLRSWARTWSRQQFAMADFVKFWVACAAALALAASLGWLLTSLGWDPRAGTWGPLGTYEQRNSLIVGFVMGFAVIPIIYTIADDAFHAVPNHLRSASLGAGATRWQTAVRIVLPAAMSGLFSALMIGLGRAVGETMIVLMAGGNTPVLDPNVFNGVRTMSANIAVELPEAVRNSTHYRTLFLSALTLFVVTFVVNTIAEIVRLRYRRRAVQL